MRTTTLGVIVFVTMGLAACSSSSSGAAAPAPATLSGSPTTPTSPASSAPASQPATPFVPVSSPSGPATMTPTVPPSAAPQPSAAPTATPPVPGVPVEEWADASGPPPPVSPHAVTAYGAVACPAPEVGGGGTGLATRLTAAVHIKAVVRCETVERSYPGLGTWTVQLAEVADTNLGPFLADLRAPSQARRTDVMCPDLVILVPWFGVVDDAGNVMRPLLPTDACGKPQTAVIAALQALPFRVTQAVRVAPFG
jgi:hypothetical protein